MGAQCSGGGAGAPSTATAQPREMAMPLSSLARRVRKRACRPDVPDPRDRVLCWPSHKKASLPKSVDLRPLAKFAFYDQGDLGSCTAQALGAAFQFVGAKKDPTYSFQPSTLFIYYNERMMEGTAGTDAGATIRSGCKSLHKLGVCDEREWPYKEEKYADEPPSVCYDHATPHKVLEYARVPNSLDDYKACLNEGYPFAFGFTCFSSFLAREVMETGVMPMPGAAWCCTEEKEGIHSGLAVGYDDDREMFIIRNSWGADWGQGGHFLMPYEFMTNTFFTSDHWVVKCVSPEDTLPTCALTQQEPRLVGP